MTVLNVANIFIINMVPGSAISRLVPVKPRSPMATLFWHLLLLVSSTLVMASCGEARMSKGMSMKATEELMGVASVRRVLATNNTVSDVT